jgi:hypothetical protein
MHPFFTSKFWKFDVNGLFKSHKRTASILPEYLSWWAHLASNQGPSGYEPVALPTELWALPYKRMNYI